MGAVKRSLVLSAFALLRCNAILGIEEAKLDPDASVMAGAGGSAGSTGSGGSGGGGMCASLKAPDPCNKCVAANCCDPFEACNNDADCKDALGKYNDCVGVAFTNDAGGTCDETFASGSQIRSNLATCAFLTAAGGCANVCMGKPVGADICTSYCSCVAATCPERDFDGGDCAALCADFTEPQLTCRPYHCGLAKISKDMGNDALRQTHCGHAFGVSLCP